MSGGIFGLGAIGALGGRVYWDGQCGHVCDSNGRYDEAATSQLFMAQTQQMAALRAMALQRGPPTVEELTGMQNAWVQMAEPVQQTPAERLAAPSDWEHRRVYIMWLATFAALAVIRWAAIGLWPL